MLDEYLQYGFSMYCVMGMSEHILNLKKKNLVYFFSIWKGLVNALKNLVRFSTSNKVKDHCSICSQLCQCILISQLFFDPHSTLGGSCVCVINCNFCSILQHFLWISKYLEKGHLHVLFGTLLPLHTYFPTNTPVLWMFASSTIDMSQGWHLLPQVISVLLLLLFYQSFWKINHRRSSPSDQIMSCSSIPFSYIPLAWSCILFRCISLCLCCVLRCLRSIG